MDPADVHIPATIPANMREGYAELMSDRDAFFSLIHIQDKTSKQQIPFAPNDAQCRFLELLETHNRVIVVKARQVGISTAVRAYHMWQAYVTKQPHKFAVLSFHERSAKNLRRMDKKWLRKLPTLMQRKMSLDTSTDSEYADTEAGLSAYTTGGRGGTRSYSFTSAHLSEFAFYIDADETLAEVLATVGDSGKIVVESTVNTVDDTYARLVREAPDNGWVVFTYWWWQYPQHTTDVPDDFIRTTEEEELSTLYDLDDGQLQWRRNMVATLTLAKFKREYPACMADAFAAKDSLYFDHGALDKIEERFFSTPVREFYPPTRGDYYVAGVDVGGGVGGDYSSIVVASATSNQPVYIERSNTMAPHLWAHKVASIGVRYNNALLLCESNNHGHVVLRELQLLKYRNLWLSSDGKQWTTTVKSKLEAFEVLREHVHNELIFCLDSTTLMELRSLQIFKVTPEASPGQNDDLAVALALCLRALRDVPASHRRNAVSSIVDNAMMQSRVKRLKDQTLAWRTNT